MKHNTNKIKFAIFVTMILTSVIFLACNWELIIKLDIDYVIGLIENRGGFVELIYLLIYAIKPFFLVIPANVVAIVGGTLFGPVQGFILSMIGFWISGTIAFYLSRFLGRGFVESIVGNKFIKLEDNMKTRGFKILFLLRLPPILPYDPLSYACGLTNISYKDFILASLLGVVPETICYSVIGRSFTSPFTPEFMIPIGFLIVATLSAKFFIKKGQDSNG